MKKSSTMTKTKANGEEGNSNMMKLMNMKSHEGLSLILPAMHQSLRLQLVVVVLRFKPMTDSTNNNIIAKILQLTLEVVVFTSISSMLPQLQLLLMQDLIGTRARRFPRTP
jgi:hypothetical protein